MINLHRECPELRRNGVDLRDVSLLKYTCSFIPIQRVRLTSSIVRAGLALQNHHKQLGSCLHTFQIGYSILPLVFIREKLHCWIKIFAKPRYLCIAEKNCSKNFHWCYEGRHVLYMYAIFKAGQKICMINFHQWSGWQIWRKFKFFLLAIFLCIAI